MKCFVCGKETKKTHERRVWEYGKEWVVCPRCFKTIPAAVLDTIIHNKTLAKKREGIEEEEEEILPPCTC
jgi:hypothetical protein